MKDVIMQSRGRHRGKTDIAEWAAEWTTVSDEAEKTVNMAAVSSCGPCLA